MKIQLLSSMEKVFPQSQPKGNGIKNNQTIWKGENFSFQIGYYWDGDRKTRGTCKINGPEALDVQVRTVGLVPCEYPAHLESDENFLKKTPGLYPDLLQNLPNGGFVMYPGQWRSLWIDVTSNVPGQYPLEIELYPVGRDTDCHTVKMEIEVLDVQMPSNPIIHTEWFHGDCLAQYYGVEIFSENHWEIIENFVKTAVKRGCNMILTPVFTPPLDTAVGGERPTVQLVDVYVEHNTYRFGFEKFERWVEMCKRCGVLYYEISHLFTQWGANAAPKIMGYKDGVYQKLFGWDTKASGQEYAEFLKLFLWELVDKLEQLNIKQDCYFHVSDEPSLWNLESYQKAKEIVKEPLAGCHMIDALSDYLFYEQGLIQEPVCANDHLERFLEHRPEKLWTYYCTSQCREVSNRFIAMPGYRTRILGMQLYKYQIDGFLHWGYNFYNCEQSLYPVDPYGCTDAEGAFPAGDPFLVYPGENGKPEESIRLMLMEEAMQDLAALTWIERLTDRETALSCLNEAENGILTFKEYPHNLEYIVEVRQRINDVIKNVLRINS